MNVLMATHYFESHRGGIEIVAGRLARELVKRGVALTWLATNATAPPADGGAQGNICAVPAWNVTEARLGFPLPLPGPKAASTIWSRVRAADAVVLHDSLYPTNVLAAVAARWHRRPVVIIQHIGFVPYANPVLRSLMRIANALITRPMLAAASQTVFISEITQRHFAGVSFALPPRVIFNGVDTDIFHPATADADRTSGRLDLGLPVDRPVALFVGRFVEKKGLHILERMARARPDITFALAGWGPIDPNSWQMPNVVVQSNLSGAALAKLYQSSDVFVLPSTGEGLPLVIQEALACGLPVLCGDETATADSGLSRLVDGIVIDPTDHDATAARFIAALDGALVDPVAHGPSQATPAQRFAFVAEHYSWARATDAYLELLRALIANEGRSALSQAVSLDRPPSPLPTKERAP